MVAPPGADGFYDLPDPGGTDVAIQEVITTNVRPATHRYRAGGFVAWLPLGVQLRRSGTRVRSRDSERPVCLFCASATERN